MGTVQRESRPVNQIKQSPISTPIPPPFESRAPHIHRGQTGYPCMSNSTSYGVLATYSEHRDPTHPNRWAVDKRNYIEADEGGGTDLWR